MNIREKPLARAMILAAGKGTRLSTLTKDIPKCLVPIGGEPIINRIIDHLGLYNINDICVNLHTHAKKVTNYLCGNDFYNKNISFSYEKELLGTAGALKQAEDLLDNVFIVYYGDVLTNLDLSILMNAHNFGYEVRAEPHITMPVYEVSDVSEGGVCSITERYTNNMFRIRAFNEKIAWNGPGLINSGILVMDKEILDYIPNNCYYDIGASLITKLLDNWINIYSYEIRPPFKLIDMGTPANYKIANDNWKEYTKLA
jgi:mannose-1-phosphate guanylyltransferase